MACCLISICARCLRRIYAQLEAGIVAASDLRPMPDDAGACTPPRRCRLSSVGQAHQRAFWRKQPVAGHFAAAGPEAPAATGASSRTTAPSAAPRGLRSSLRRTQAPWQGYAPQRCIRSNRRGPMAASKGCHSNPGRPRRSLCNSRNLRPSPDGQAQQRPAQTYAPQPQAQSQPQPETPQPQRRKAPQEKPQPVAPAAKTKRLKPERAARPSTWLLNGASARWSFSVAAFGLWIAFGDPSGHARPASP